MAAKSKSAPPAGAKLVVTRAFTAPPEVVFDAWLDAEAAKRWLFATPTGQMVRAETDPRPGGRFVFVRRDGDDVEHTGEYLEIDRPRRLVFTFGVPKFSPDFTRVTVEIAPAGAGCQLTLTQEGVPAEWTEQTRSGWTMILNNLAGSLGEAGGGTPDFVLSREFDAPRELVFQAWTDPRHVARWWGPREFANPSCVLDVRPGGKWRIVMRGPDGADHPVKGTYAEILAPQRIVMTIDHSELPDDWHDVVNPGWDRSNGRPVLPIMATVTFDDVGGKTKLTLRLAFEAAAVKSRLLEIGMSEGWSQSLDRLGEVLAAMK